MILNLCYIYTKKPLTDSLKGGDSMGQGDIADEADLQVWLM